MVDCRRGVVKFKLGFWWNEAVLVGRGKMVERWWKDDGSAGEWNFEAIHGEEFLVWSVGGG